MCHHPWVPPGIFTAPAPPQPRPLSPAVPVAGVGQDPCGFAMFFSTWLCHHNPCDTMVTSPECVPHFAVMTVKALGDREWGLRLQVRV